MHFYWMYSSHAFLLRSSTCLCAHPYCIPAPACAHLYYVQAISGCNSINSQHFPLCASLLYSSIACVHSYYVQALPVDISIMPSIFLRAHPYCTPALSACIPTMFKHFLACICIFPCARSCSIPALPHAENYPKVVHYGCIFHVCFAFPLHFHYISITFPLHFHCISFPALLAFLFIAFLFHCISFPTLLASSYIAS